jgi:hypothetical protein
MELLGCSRMTVTRYWQTSRLPAPEYPVGPNRPLWRKKAVKAHLAAAAAAAAAQNAIETASARGKRVLAMRRDRLAKNTAKAREAKIKPPTDTDKKKPVRKSRKPAHTAAVEQHEEINFERRGGRLALTPVGASFQRRAS